ncbi:hypothetical protein OG429_35615 [Streptomyces sp. NBC_00190]|uniref:hypothetical protein n=1 Tax=unclassified Streptomyces TaxID=2593676 RepID=UPI002E2993EC|nr:hypothetical protein [Streptomyces sp. NBC_00190]WSZ44129.1 hypothetical protein OG239_38080 [Streptomyces sp. NBC_00868]
MPASAGPRRVLTAATAAAVLLAGLTGLTGCGKKDGGTPGSASPSASASGSASPSATPTESAASPPVSASASPSATPAAASSAPSASATTPAAPPAAPTRLKVAVDTRGGGLALVRGGAAQEFTVTLRNGNSSEYRHLLVAFQMEILVGEPGDRPGSGPGFLLERFDQASGTWRAAALRIANDRMPESMYAGGGPLAREGVRVERYRMRATAGGPTGSSPLVVSIIDTDADGVAAHVVLSHSTR